MPTPFESAVGRSSSSPEDLVVPLSFPLNRRALREVVQDVLAASTLVLGQEMAIRAVTNTTYLLLIPSLSKTPSLLKSIQTAH